MTVNLQSDQITPQDLRNAAIIIDHVGLAKGDYVDGEGACCAVGAIGVAKYGYGTILLAGRETPFLTDAGIEFVEDVINEDLVNELLNLNDKLETTAEMVADRLVQLADQMEGVE